MNQELSEKLAHAVVDAWDMDTLLGFAYDKMQEFYSDPENKEDFDSDWESFIGEDEE